MSSPHQDSADSCLVWACAWAMKPKPTPLIKALAKKWLGWLPRTCHIRTVSGFTLAELLIALALLGVIATFTIPKIMTATQNAQKIAVFKETLATISQNAYNASLLDDTTYFPAHLNSVKVCAANAATQGCFPQAYGGGGSENTQPGYVLHNGAVITGVDRWTLGYTGIAIDWNGPSPPNVYGDDQIWLWVCFGLGGSCAPKQPGAIWPIDATSTTLWNEIYQ